MSDARKLQGDFQEYQESLINHSEGQQRMLYDRLMQNANVIVLALSFIFLFEMTFVGGVFPDHPSSISLPRYWASLSALYVANVFLVLALALLLAAIVRFNAPWAVRDDFSPSGEFRFGFNRLRFGMRFCVLRRK